MYIDIHKISQSVLKPLLPGTGNKPLTSKEKDIYINRLQSLILGLIIGGGISKETIMGFIKQLKIRKNYVD
jgi:hypothetical protein